MERQFSREKSSEREPPPANFLRQSRYERIHSCCRKGFDICSTPSAGQMSTTEVPRQTTRPKFRVSSVSLNGSSGSRMYSVVPSNTKLSNGSKPLRTPEDSRPPENLTRMVLSRYFDKSKMDSFFFFSPPARSPPPFFSSCAPDIMFCF